MFSFFEELFAPGRKHTAEEQKRLELSRVDLNTGDPGRGPIDLSSGRVTVRTAAPRPGPATSAQETPGQEAAGQKPPGQDDARPGG